MYGIRVALESYVVVQGSGLLAVPDPFYTQHSRQLSQTHEEQSSWSLTVYF